ncbi:MAG: MBL fold metallo-hydrolase [Syntrophorhabdaceae bacterium]|nr:MBL fold metallo-hydrolase [Syntrophorhabdaceae bacterium]
MKIKYYGHAAFMIETESGVRIILDPYQSGAFGGALSYGKITDEADIVLTSHDHDDHNYTKDIKGSFKHIKGAGSYEEKGVKVRGIPCYHDESTGKERGTNIIFLVEGEGITVAHLGDLGHPLSKKEVEEIGKVDVLLIPVGGYYTIDAKTATKVMDTLKPLLTVPMHYKTEKCQFPIAPVEDFIKDKGNVKRVKGSEYVIKKDTLPPQSEIVVLEHAL